jgi:UDP-N-acetyl-D-galactosamine dehydrogenase
MDDSAFAEISKSHALVADVKGVYRGKIKTRNYWSL